MKPAGEDLELDMGETEASWGNGWAAGPGDTEEI